MNRIATLSLEGIVGNSIEVKDQTVETRRVGEVKSEKRKEGSQESTYSIYSIASPSHNPAAKLLPHLYLGKV